MFGIRKRVGAWSRRHPKTSRTLGAIAGYNAGRLIMKPVRRAYQNRLINSMNRSGGHWTKRNMRGLTALYAANLGVKVAGGIGGYKFMKRRTRQV